MDELTALRAENDRLKQHLNEWWRAASAIVNAEPGTDAERQAWSDFEALRTGNSFSDAGPSVTEFLQRDRNRLAAENERLREALKPFSQGHLYAYEELRHLPDVDAAALNPYDPERSPTAGDCRRAAEALNSRVPDANG